MGQPFPPPSANPFPTSDPIRVGELDPEQLAWRITLHVLAVTGRFVHVPAGLRVNYLQLQIAAGWAYRPRIRPASDGGTTISCELTGWTPDAGGSETGDPYANALTVTALPEFAERAAGAGTSNGHPHSGVTGRSRPPTDNQA